MTRECNLGTFTQSSAFAGFREYRPEGTVELGYNVMKGTEYFLSL
jgi:hypothetical protein